MVPPRANSADASENAVGGGLNLSSSRNSSILYSQHNDFFEMSLKNQQKLRNMTPVCLNKNVNMFGNLIDNSN